MRFKWEGGKPLEQAYTPSYRWGWERDDEREKDVGLWKLRVERSEWTRYHKDIGGSAVTNEEIITGMPKGSQEIVGTRDISWILHILKSAPLPWGSLWRSPSFVSEMLPWGLSCWAVPGAGGGISLHAGGVLCAEEDKDELVLWAMCAVLGDVITHLSCIWIALARVSY